MEWEWELCLGVGVRDVCTIVSKSQRVSRDNLSF